MGSDDGDDGAGWGEDDELELDLTGVEIEADEEGDSTYFVAPTAGTLPSQNWVANSSVVADHVAAGAFDSAMQVRDVFGDCWLSGFRDMCG